MKRLLLISSSRTHGTGYLDHCSPAIQQRLAQCQRVLFVPFALQDHDGYAATARDKFLALDIQLDSIHDSADPTAAVASAESIFIGGGNSFRLAKALYDLQLMDAIRDRVATGMPYLGASAGTNMACPTMRTTNDMPIVEPPSLTTLGLVPFQINAHYIDADPASTHQGETREQRLAEFHEENTTPVVALREGSWLMIDGDQCRLEGSHGAVLFRAGQDKAELATGTQWHLSDSTFASIVRT